MKNKKGEGTPIWIIIALVLGILVLVMLAMGFVQGWGNLWGKLIGWTGGASTLSSVAQACEVNCASKVAYCQDGRKITDLTEGQANDIIARVVTGAPLTQKTPDDLSYKDRRPDAVAPAVLDPPRSSVVVSADKKTVNGITCQELQRTGIGGNACPTNICA